MRKERGLGKRVLRCDMWEHRMFAMLPHDKTEVTRVHLKNSLFYGDC
jgi:hypothetical protein